MRQNEPGQGSLPLGEPYKNQGLFADRYLTDEERLLALPEWREAQGVEEAFEALQKLYEERAAQFGEGTNEAKTEADFIRPVLAELGWEYEVQEPIAGVNRVPDYALLTSAEEKQQIQPLKGRPELWEHVAAVGDAKRWEQDLDRRRADETPSIQITNYLYRSKVRWGLLTNGRKWRLYEQDKARGGDTYYEVDLVDLLQEGDLEAFKYFLLFFRRDAFVPVRDDKCFVELVFEGSERYRTEVGDDLKEAVYDALRTLMNGFLAFERNGLAAEDEDQLTQVHDLSLTVLYRLLFLLYAEDKDLLPTGDPLYRDYSLLSAQRDISERLRAQQAYAANAKGLWDHFLNTCYLIDEGLREGERQVIPAYNGGLFSCERYPEIAYEPQDGVARWEIGDAYLAEAIDQVAYKRESWDQPGTEDVDYATLDVQHLGSIYEGLLELKPQVAEERMFEQPGASGKPPVVKTRSEVKQPKKVRGQRPREFAPGETYLVTDRGERKATGSYYTPKYIVDYIVEHTVGELAEEAATEVRERWEQVSRDLGCQRLEDLDSLIAYAQDGTKRQRLEDKRRSLLEPYLSLKVLDPAMGSGHFLVGAADYLSLAMATDPWLPPVPEEEAHEQQAYYKRLVVQHCLFGVDLNPLAVELAKLSLWLHTVSRDKALSFLDHHLRCGNSLIGARLQEDLGSPPPAVGGGEQEGEGPQLAMQFDATLERNDLVAFLDAFRRIVEAPVGDAEVERQKDAWYREMDERRNPYRQVANLWLAPYFGVQVMPQQYGDALEALRASRGSDQWHELTGQEWFQQAQDAGGPDGRRFFHWELEFPEAFFQVQQGRADWKPDEERGFDAVIGNPPWVSMKGKHRSGDWADADVTCLVIRLEGDPYRPNLVEFFSRAAMRNLAVGGYHSFVVPDRIAENEQYVNLRELLLEENALTRMVFRVPFPEVIADTLIYVAQGGSPDGYQVAVGDWGWGGRMLKVPVGIYLSNSDKAVFSIQSDNEIELIASLFQMEHRLAPHIARTNTGFIAAAGTVTQHRVASDQIEVLKGENVSRYAIKGRFYFSFSPSNVVGGTNDPDILSTTNKVLVRKTGGFVQASLVTEGVFPEQSLYQIWDIAPPHSPRFVLALMNSRLTQYLYAKVLVTNRGSTPQLKKIDLDRIPIRVVDFPAATDAERNTGLLRDSRQAVTDGNGEQPSLLVRRALAAHALAVGKELPPWTHEHFSEEEVEELRDFPGREDFVHDLLAELAQRMIDLNKDEHDLIERFEADLRGLAAPEAAEKLQKGKQARTLFKHESCQPFVEEGSHSTHSLHESLAWSEEAFEVFVRELAGKVPNLSDLLAAYRTYADDYRDLTEALTRTDELIDQIVYALYGLTEEGIRIVEESVQG